MADRLFGAGRRHRTAHVVDHAFGLASGAALSVWNLKGLHRNHHTESHGQPRKRFGTFIKYYLLTVLY